MEKHRKQTNCIITIRKFKLPKQQNGQVYLTSHRICYVDRDEPRANSVSLDLKDVDKYEFYAGFLKSSPKITLIPKRLKRGALRGRASSHTGTSAKESSSNGGSFPPPQPLPQVNWVCTICSFSNPIPVGFDPSTANQHTPLPPCKACGIKPTLSHILKAALMGRSKQELTYPNSDDTDQSLIDMRQMLDAARNQTNGGIHTNNTTGRNGSRTEITCPRCTFSNHPSLNTCEICNEPLPRQTSPFPAQDRLRAAREESPGPTLDPNSTLPPEGSEGVKISFRDGGAPVFYERLKGSITQRKWLLQNAPPVPTIHRPYHESQSAEQTDNNRKATKTAGIAGLEQLGLNMRKNNEILIGSAFEDLEALMASAKEVVALAERFARQNNSGSGNFSAEESAILAESASQLGLITTKDMLGGGKSESLYLSELSRNVAEFLTDDSRGVLKKVGGILTLVDLWAMFNRARGGVELVSPMDFEKAARLWESLKLPVRLRTFRSGVMVVQGRDRTDEITIKALLTWLQDLHEFPPEREVEWDWREFGRGVTPQDAAERFGWSIGVAEEELLLAEERGVVCRDEGLEGLRFWENLIGTSTPEDDKASSKGESDAMVIKLQNLGFI